jgi:hypothetical protein
VKPDLLSVVDAAYDLESDDEAWLDGVLRAAEPHLGEGRFLIGYTYDFSDPSNFQVESFVTRNVSPRSSELARTVTCTLANHYHREILSARPYWLTLATASDLGRERVQRFVSSLVASDPRGELSGVRDFLAVATIDPMSRGCVLLAGLLRPAHAPPDKRQAWVRVSEGRVLVDCSK